MKAFFIRRFFAAALLFLLSAGAFAEFKMFVDAGRVCSQGGAALSEGEVFLLADLQGGEFEDFALASADGLKEGEVFGGALLLARGAFTAEGACGACADIELEGNEFLGGGEAFAILVLDKKLSGGKVQSGTKFLLFRRPEWFLNSENRGVYFYNALSVSAGGGIENSALCASAEVEPSDGEIIGIKIEKQPESAEVFEKQKCEFSVSASDAEGRKLIYTWEVDKGKGWAAAGSSKDTIKVSASLKSDGFKYRCKIQNEKNGEPVYTNEALLTVRGNVKITTKPKALAVFEGGENAGFSVGASGYGARYQWQIYVQKPNANGKMAWVWQDIDGATSPNFTPQNENLELSGAKFRCMVYNGGGAVYTGSVGFTVRGAARAHGIKILQNKAEVSAGGLYEEFDIVLEAAASGYKIKFQWQVFEGGIWQDVKKAAKASLKISKPTAAACGGKMYRCKIYNEGGAAFAEAPALEIAPCLAPSTLKGERLKIEYAQKTYILDMSSSSAGALSGGDFSSKASVSYRRLSPTAADFKISAKIINAAGELEKVVWADKKFDFETGELSGARVEILPRE
ncbi:MAG: hypothetical protein IKS15_02105 [Opitutales bacterium]|nr:hypothetical protein [Opitutales bacterium]